MSKPFESIEFCRRALEDLSTLEDPVALDAIKELLEVTRKLD